jgi:DNA modification methylase
MANPKSLSFVTENGSLLHGDVLETLAAYDDEPVQLILADPPYFQVLEDQDWDTSWPNAEAYLEWTEQWVSACRRILAPDGLLYIFGQLGKREHVWLHTCSRLTKFMQFHDMIIWDRAVGYNERSDSFTPQYEMILVLRPTADTPPHFNKDAVRLPYDEATIQTYLRDPRYKDKAARETHLRKGKYATNILRIPSLKGTSKEKVGHPSQKPLTLIENLIASSSRPGDLVLDPFMGSGTTAVSCEKLNRRWLGIEANPDYVRMTKKRLQAYRDSIPPDLFADPDRH